MIINSLKQLIKNSDVEPYGWFKVDEATGITEEVHPHIRPPEAGAFPLYTSPPTEAAIREMALREAMKALEENEQYYARDTVRDLIPQPSALEALLLYVANKSAGYGWSMGMENKGVADPDLKSIIAKTLKEWENGK